MAGAQHNPSRRALLGAAVGLPFATASAEAVAGPLHQPSPAAAAGPLPRTGEDWARALARFEAAEGELRRFEAFCSGRPFEEQGALEPGYDSRSDKMYSALRRLLRAPAPDVAALAAKLDLVVEHEVGTLEGGEECLAAICRDARRLAGRGA